MCSFQVTICPCGAVQQSSFVQCERYDLEEGQFHPVSQVQIRVSSCETCRYRHWAAIERQRQQVGNRRLAYVASKAYSTLARGESLQPGSEQYGVVNAVTKHILAAVEKQYSMDFDAGKRLHPFSTFSHGLVKLREECLYTRQAAKLEECIRRQSQIDTSQREMTEEDKVYSLTALRESGPSIKWEDEGMTVSFGKFLDLFPSYQRELYYDHRYQGLDLMEDIHAYIVYLVWCFTDEGRQDFEGHLSRFQWAVADVYHGIIDFHTNTEQEPLEFRPQPCKPGMPVVQTWPEWAASRVESFGSEIDINAGGRSTKAALFFQKLVIDYRLYLLESASETSLSCFDALIEGIIINARDDIIELCEPRALFVRNPDIFNLDAYTTMEGDGIGDLEEDGEILPATTYAPERGRRSCSPDSDVEMTDVAPDERSDYLDDPPRANELRPSPLVPSEEGEVGE